ncbi:MAG: hypothetical protein CL531_00055 [Aestuariibacter sp.]|nr:hypothetical protein [Aestuariibacter sp.]MCP4256089.1 hypothetical protein [Planctomycetota bacterium]|tara:strand:- start:17564 stop:18133 length:570 start_codon:yes stop_codon:yes gene_type:complete
MATQNAALVWLMYFNRLIDCGHVKMDAYNPKVFYLDAYTSAHFMLGRDIEHEPFLAVPNTYMPFFTEVDWVEVSINRKEGYLFLEARDPKTQMLHMALGFKVRRARLDTVCIEGKEDINSLRFNIKVFEADPDDPQQVVFNDQHEIVGLPIKEVSSSLELGTELDSADSRSMLEESGVSKSYTTLKITQ